MANFEIKMNQIAHFPIMGRDAAGDLVALDAETLRGVVATVSDPTAATATVNHETNMLDVDPLMLNADYTIETDDAVSGGGLAPFSLACSNVDDLTPTSVALDVAAVTFTPKTPTPPVP